MIPLCGDRMGGSWRRVLDIAGTDLGGKAGHGCAPAYDLPTEFCMSNNDN